MSRSTVSDELRALLLLGCVQNHRQLKAAFSLGLILFAALLLVPRVWDLHLFFTMRHDDSHGLQMFLSEAGRSVAFAILLWITWR